jgi:uncharacterized protein YqeY
MGIYDDVNNQLKEAMKARDEARTRGLRGIRAAFIVEMKSDNSTSLDDARCAKALKSLAKQRKDSIDSYKAANREDLAQLEQDELSVIEAFLPQTADEATVEGWVAAAIASTGASSTKELGKVLGLVMKDHKDEVDGALVRSIATRLLS